MSERIGIGIICFYGADEVARNVASVREHCQMDYTLLLFDNSENDEVGEWARGRATDVLYVRSPYNVGCSIARNRIAERFASLGLSHFVIQDQDVRWVGDAAAAMRAVFARHKDTGVVSWHLATRQMSAKNSDYKPDATGCIPETPGMCCMYSMKCVRAIVKLAERDNCPYCRAWNTRVFMYRFDSLFCGMARKAGFKVRVVWPDQNLVRHDHPHKGVARYPWMRREQLRSKAIFKDEVKRHGLSVPKGLL
jgi:GT2 family glycosyltransferase